MILTNNPRVLSIYPSALWISGGPLEILQECRKKIHEGFPLLNYPLIGDLRLLQNPFRTVHLGEKKGDVNLTSLNWIEECIERVRLSFAGSGTTEALADYQFLDLDLFRNSIVQ
jgi:hypothetical protein